MSGRARTWPKRAKTKVLMFKYHAYYDTYNDVPFLRKHTLLFCSLIALSFLTHRLLNGMLMTPGHHTNVSHTNVMALFPSFATSFVRLLGRLTGLTDFKPMR